MKKKLLVSVISLLLIVAMAAGFTAAQQQKMVRVHNNFVTIGKVDVQCDPPNQLIKQGPMAVGEEYKWTGKLKSTADIKQDVYAGLCDEYWQGPGQLGEEVEFALKVGDNWVAGWTDVDWLFKNWLKLVGSMDPGAEVDLEIWLRLDPAADYTDLMGVTHWFEVLLFAVNVGGTPPSSKPYTFKET